MKIYITGSNGFLAQKFCEVVFNEAIPCEIFGVSKSTNRNLNLSSDQFQQLDLLDFESLGNSLRKFKPTHILHTAAITSVEACEADKERALHTNVLLTKYLAEYAKDENIHLTFLSTDFVFDGLNGPYKECDTTSPLNYYGQTKVEAEGIIQNLGVSAAIIRTILLYGAIPDASRSNLVLWVKKELEEHRSIRVVYDQWRMPTWVDDLARACLITIVKNASGLFHISGEEMRSINELAQLVANTFGLDRNLISSISASELGQEENRPRKTGFVLSKSKSELELQPTPFVESLHYICEQLKKYGR